LLAGRWVITEMIADKMQQKQPDTGMEVDNSEKPVDNPSEDSQESNVSPEEQAIYSSVVSNAMKVIYGEKTMPNILKMLQSANEPSEGVAQVTNMIGEQVYSSAQKQGQEISDDVLQAASEEINGLLFELGEKAGIFKEISDDDQFKAQVRTYELWDKAHPGMMDKEGMKSSIAGIDKNKLSEIVSQMGGE